MRRAVKDSSAPAETAARAVGSGEFTKNAKDFKADFEALIGNGLEEALRVLTREADVKMATEELRAIFSMLGRRGADLGETLAEADSELNRGALKAQSLAFQLKLEASRSAASVSLKNQVCAHAPPYPTPYR